MLRRHHLDLAHVLSLCAGLALLSLASGVRSQPRPAMPTCSERCGHAEREAVARCAGRHDCVSDARLDARRCALRCDTTMSEGDRCRAQCDIDSDACDAGCNRERNDGERRGCLRRCGSHFHISCPQDCPP